MGEEWASLRERGRELICRIEEMLRERRRHDNLLLVGKPPCSSSSREHLHSDSSRRGGALSRECEDEQCPLSLGEAEQESKR